MSRLMALLIAIAQAAGTGGGYRICHVVRGRQECAVLKPACKSEMTLIGPKGLVRHCRHVSCERIRRDLDATLEALKGLPAGQAAIDPSIVACPSYFELRTPAHGAVGCIGAHDEATTKLQRVLSLTMESCG